MAMNHRHHHYIPIALGILLTHLLLHGNAFSTSDILSKNTKINRHHHKHQHQVVDASQLLIPSFASSTTLPKLDRRDKHTSKTLLQMTASASSFSSESDGLGSSSSSVRGETSTDMSEPKPTASNNEDDKLDMPWSEVQEWALDDNLPKFTVIIPKNGSGEKSKRYAMWRTLTREVPELAGYPIPFLRQMHQRLLLKKDTDNTNKSSSSSSYIVETPGVLPMVDMFVFASNGGIAGQAYGLPGIADGTRIQTPPLISSETTIPLGYVTIQGDDNINEVGFSYELGTCGTSMDGSGRESRNVVALAAARRLVIDGALDSSKQVVNVAKDIADTATTGSLGLLSDKEANQDMIYLGGATALLLTAATAVGMLSHHLTVNVFWV